jgi:hypothetical protein
MARKVAKTKKKEVKAVAVPEQEKRERGRPSGYKPEYALQAFKLCLLGSTDQDLADFFGVVKQTIYNWQEQHQDFLDSIADGKRKADAEVAHSAFRRATFDEYFEEVPTKIKRTTYDEKGKKIAEYEEVVVTRVRKVLPPDPTTLRMWLHNRASDRWKDRQQIEVGKPGDFANMQDEDLLRYIQEEAIELSRGLGGKPDESPGRVVAKGSDSRH